MTTNPEALATAIQLHQAGRLQTAEQIYRQILGTEPNQADAIHLLGVIAHQMGKHGIAVEYIGRAIGLRGNSAIFHNNLGEAYRALRRIPDALACYRQAVELKPDYAEAHYNQGVVFQDLGNRDEAIASYRQALALEPDYAEAHNNLGSVLREQGKLEEALTCFRQAEERKPGDVEAPCNQGIVLAEQGKPVEALACYRRALERKPDDASALGAVVHTLQHLCFWEDLKVLSERLIDVVESETNGAIVSPVPPFFTLSLPAMTTAEQQLRCARRWAKKLDACREVAGRTGPARLDRTRSKIRVGYLSADFHSHAVAYLIAEVIEKHDRERFEIHGYSLGDDDGGPMRRRLVHAFDNFVDVKDYAFVEAAHQITADDIDILVDLNGYTRGARTQILAMRPAPVQVNYLGYPGTMGVDFIDYILVDDFIVPPDSGFSKLMACHAH